MSNFDDYVVAECYKTLGPKVWDAFMACVRLNFIADRDLKGVFAISHEFKVRPRVIACLGLWLPALNSPGMFVDMTKLPDGIPPDCAELGCLPSNDPQMRCAYYCAQLWHTYPIKRELAYDPYKPRPEMVYKPETMESIAAHARALTE